MVDLIEVKGISKSFPGVVALDDVSFSCRAGEVHAIVGENGAGKSTMMKILAGAYEPDQGDILIEGKSVRLASPRDAQELGISIIYQELNLLPDMNLAQNVFLGRESHGRLHMIDDRDQQEHARELLRRLGIDLDPRTRLGQLSVAQQQMVEIAKALSLNARLVIMDEPSAPLGGRDLDYLFDIIRALKDQGVSVIYISHRIAEVFQVADRVTVFKDAKSVGTFPIEAIDRGSLVRMMIGKTFSETFPPRGRETGSEVLSVEGLTVGHELTDVSLEVRAGEIVGISGLVGSGRTRLAHAIFGSSRRDAGVIKIHGKPVSIRSPNHALIHRMGFLTEDRNAEGLILGQDVIKNAALPSLETRQRWGIVQRAQERHEVAATTVDLQLRAPSLSTDVENLSGGNRQKVVLAKWLISHPDLLIFDEPTRGIDVGAKGEIWQLMRNLANQGKAILMISSELPEIIGMSDRIYVMHNGRIVGERSGDEADEEEVMMLATYGETYGH